MIVQLVAGVVGILAVFVGSAVRGGLALAGGIGLLLIGLAVYTPLPTGSFGCALFAACAVLFVLAGGMRGA